MTSRDELYQIAIELERFSEDGLKDEPRKQLQVLVDRLMLIAKDLA
jgi:hypothetical protein